MALNYVNFEYHKNEQTEPIQELVRRYMEEEKLFLERPKEVSEYKALDRILVSVDSEFVDEFIDELNKFPPIAVKKHA